MSFGKDKKVIHSLRTQVDSFGRKKYRLEQVIQSGQESQNEDQKATVVDTGRHKSMLIGREQGLNIDKYIGKIDINKKKKVTEVFYCDICSEGFKCDMAYITHINSPGHNRKLGMSMKVKNVSLETVSSKISSLINKKLGKRENDQEQDELIIKMENKNGENARMSLKELKRSMGINDNDNEDEERQQDQEQENDDGQGQEEQQVKQQERQEKQQEQQQEEEQQQMDSNELAQQEMMMQMGFGSKKQKR